MLEAYEETLQKMQKYKNVMLNWIHFLLFKNDYNKIIKIKITKGLKKAKSIYKCCDRPYYEGENGR
jgi:hypothetical protein